MKVSEIGEFALVERISEVIGQAQQFDVSDDALLVGIGDDAACWRSEGLLRLASIDSLVEGVHFALDRWSWYDLGWKALAISLSDIAAMGGLPRYCLVSLTIPGEVEVNDVSMLYEGMLDLAGLHQVAIVGGNTSSAPLVSITTSVFGYSTGGIMRRSSAKPGDKIAVTGTLGTAAACLGLLKKDVALASSEFETLRQALFRPRPKIAEGQFLARVGVKTAMDISDGLALDLEHICKSSGVAARVETYRIPLLHQLNDLFGKEALNLAIGGGEDYEILFTAPPETMQKVLQEASFMVTVVGDVLSGQGIVFIDDSKKEVELKMRGWEHFVAGSD